MMEYKNLIKTKFFIEKNQYLNVYRLEKSIELYIILKKNYYLFIKIIKFNN
jgi:hypothetical protein